MKLLLLDVENNELKTVEANGLDDYYKYLNCRTIDIVYRKINDVECNIICDDEGLLKQNPKVSAVDITGKPILVGNLLVASGKVTDDGELIEPTPEEIQHFMENTAEVTTSVYKEPFRIFVEMEY